MQPFSSLRGANGSHECVPDDVRNHPVTTMRIRWFDRGACHPWRFTPVLPLQRFMFVNMPHRIGRYVLDVADNGRTAVTIYSQFLGRALPTSSGSTQHYTTLSRFVREPTHHHPWAIFCAGGRFRVSAARHDCPRERCTRQLPNLILLILRAPPKHWSVSPRCSPR
jgi:hypothetical protein